MGQISHFLGNKFAWQQLPDQHLAVHLSQEAFAEQLTNNHGLADSQPTHTSYHTGHPIDSIPKPSINPRLQSTLSTQMRSMVGSLL